MSEHEHMHRRVGEYANAVGRHGPDCEQARRLREAHAEDREFLEYADALDRIKRHLGGSGMDGRQGRGR